MAIEEVENEKFENFAKQFKNVPKEKVVKLLYEALEENGLHVDAIGEAIDFLECIQESSDYIKKSDLNYLKNLLSDVIK